MMKKADSKSLIFIAGCIFLGCLAIFLRFYKLGEVPSGIHIDEAGMGYDAWCIANYGVDRWLNSFPVQFINFGQGQNALYTYLYALILAVTGGEPDVYTMRLPAVIINLIMIGCAMRLGYHAFQKKGCLAAGLLTCVCPVFIMSSRWALESYLMYGMCTICVTMLTEAVIAAKGWKKHVWFVMTGVAMGLTLYTYAISYIVLPVFLLLVLAYLLYLRKISLVFIFELGLPLGILALPLILMLMVNSFGWDSIQLGIITIPRLPLYRSGEVSLEHIFLSFVPTIRAMFFNDYLGYSAYDGYYTMYLISIPFAVIGLVACVRSSIKAIVQKQFSVQVVILSFFAAVLCMGRLINGAMININQFNAVFFPLWFLTMNGILVTGNIFGKYGKWIFTGVVAMAYLICTVFFLNIYWYQKPVRFQQLYKEGIEWAQENCTYDTVYIDYGAQKVFYLFEQCPDPYEQPFSLEHQEYYDNVNCYMSQYTVIDPANIYFVSHENKEWMDLIGRSEYDFLKKEFDGYTLFY